MQREHTTTTRNATPQRDSKGRFVKRAPAHEDVTPLVINAPTSARPTLTRDKPLVFVPGVGYTPLVKMPLNAQQSRSKSRRRSASKVAKQSRRVNR